MPTLDLSGVWQCALDAVDGLRFKQFFAPEPELGVPVTLPNTTDLLGLGEPVPGESTAHPTRRHRHVGRVWWWRDIVIPEGESAARWELFLERPHGRTEAWFAGAYLGLRDSLGTPQVFSLGRTPKPGSHRLVLCTDNREHVPVGLAWDGQGSIETVAHSTSEHTQSNWNGVVGRIELRPRPRRWVRRHRVTTTPDARGFHLQLNIGNQMDLGAAQLSATVLDGTEVVAQARLELPAETNPCVSTTRECSLDLDLGDRAQPWSEHDPKLYRLRLELASDHGTECLDLPVGLRHLRREGRAVLLNGRRIFFRGTLECAQFPLTGHPPMEPGPWRKIMRAVQEHGLNHLRFHSWCPPEAAFVAADEAGVYLQVEAGVWGMVGARDDLDRFVVQESERMLDTYGHHPSFAILCHGNEPLMEEARWWLADWLRPLVATDTGRLHATAAGWHGVDPATVLMGSFTEQPVPGAPADLRLHLWGAGLDGPLTGADRGTQHEFPGSLVAEHPFIAHEIGQWMAYPDVAEAARWTGPLEARNLRWFGRDLARAGLQSQAREFLEASGRLQLLCYKTEIEAQLATPGHCGFQLLGLTDFTGQGTATVGVLNAFWEGKGYHTASEYRAFSGPCVPLALFPKHVWSRDEHFRATLRVTHAGAAPLRQACLQWRLWDAAGAVCHEGELPARDFAIDVGQAAGELDFAWATLPAPARYRLELQLGEARNDWDLWLYPQTVELAPAAGVLVAQELNPTVEAHLHAGGSVLWLVPPDTVDNPKRCSWAPVFWNTAWAVGQEPTTHGLLIREAHPALAEFPTRASADFQWHDLARRARALVLDHLPQVSPIVQVIDDCYTNRRLALLAEVRVGAGRLMVCSMDLDGDLAARPAARQLRHSLLRHLAGPEPAGLVVTALAAWRRCLRPHA